MNSSKKIKNIINLIALTAGISAMFISIPAYAFDKATLSGIEISSFNDNSYKITLKTDKTIPLEKEITNDNKIVIDLKNVKPASFVNTVYNNSTKIDNVIIHPVSDKEIKIVIEGQNVASSMIKFGKQDLTNLAGQSLKDSINNVDDHLSGKFSNKKEKAIPTPAKSITEETLLPKSITENMKKERQIEQKIQTVVLNPPVSSFKPPSDYYDSQEETSLKKTKNNFLSNKSLKLLLGSSIIDTIMRLITLIILLITGIKLFASKNRNHKINLYNDINNMKDREYELLREINEKRSPILPSLKDKPKPTYDRVNSKLNVRSKYGLQEYQNSQLPPNRKTNYNKPLPETNKNLGMTKIKNDTNFSSIRNKTPKVAQRESKSPPSLNTNRITNRDMNTSKVNIDGVKFLENMARIYEKSGRGDLAQGIQNNISRSAYNFR